MHEAEPRSPSQRYHWMIVTGATLFGVAAAAMVVAMFFSVGINRPVFPFRDLVMLVVLGALLGVAVACTLAPKGFFEGPSGQKWLELIGGVTAFPQRSWVRCM